jgi:hypothetical protein
MLSKRFLFINSPEAKRQGRLLNRKSEFRKPTFMPLPDNYGLNDLLYTTHNRSPNLRVRTLNYRTKLEMQSILLGMVITFVVIIASATHTEAIDKTLPFSPGERLTFQVKWGFIPAGEGILEVLPIETVKGIKAYHFLMTTKTNPFIDIFYKVRDQIDSYTDIGMTHSILYKYRKQGKSEKDIIVNFDWEKSKAQYTNFGKERKPIPIMPGSFDPLSVFYALRLHDLRENIEIHAPVTDGKRCVIGRAKIIQRETVKVASGTYETFLAEPELQHISGVFEKSKHAKLQIWVTADNYRMPVKIKSSVYVGSFIAELVSVKQIGTRSGSSKRQ